MGVRRARGDPDRRRTAGVGHEVLATMPRQTSTTALTRLAAAIRDLLCGQQSDLSFERRTDVELAECLAMVKHKTARRTDVRVL